MTSKVPSSSVFREWCGTPDQEQHGHSSLLTVHLAFIHLVITSSCQEGEHASQELLKFDSKFCKFLVSAFWPR